MDYPESIEAVALKLFERISEAEEKEERRRNLPVRRDLLDLYAACLSTVMRSEIDAPLSPHRN